VNHESFAAALGVAERVLLHRGAFVAAVNTAVSRTWKNLASTH
jgi:hypothetical protein